MKKMALYYYSRENVKPITKGKSIFDVLENYLREECILFRNILPIATDGTPVMVGEYRGLISYLEIAVEYNRCTLCDSQARFGCKKTLEIVFIACPSTKFGN